ncbi:hypothetical protein BVX97_02005 [bacterium E08(2017)]|nr:hypothetical protein BVX97_02005 [bacterium E08(2017)]
MPAAYPILHTQQNTMMKTQRSMAKLATGLNILNASDDPSGLAQSERLRSIIGRYEAALSNIDNASNYVNTADSYLQNMHNISGRMEELAVAANDGTKSDVERSALQAEFEQLQGAMSSITGGDAPLATYNGNEMFDGSTKTFAVGPEPGQELTVGGNDLRPTSTEVIGQYGSGGDVVWSDVVNPGGINISTQGAAANALEALKLTNTHISSVRTNLGAQSSRLYQSRQAISSAQTNTLMTEGRIRNTDYARETVNFNKYLTLGKTATGMLGNIIGVG